jgi:hypothetical protein
MARSRIKDRYALEQRVEAKHKGQIVGGESVR